MRAFQRAFLAWCCLLLVAGSEVVGDETESDRESKIQQLGALFSPAGTPSFVDKKWVEVETGPANEMRTVEGWLIEDSPERILLLDFYGNRHPLRRPAATEERQVLPTTPTGGIRSEDLEDADYSVFWGLKDKDFDAKSQKFLADGPPKPKEEEGDEGDIFRSINRFNERKSEAIGQVLSAARFAHAAYVRGNKQHAIELYQYAVQRHREYCSTYPGRSPDENELLRFITYRIANASRRQAVSGAHHGEPRGKLLQIWQEVAAMPSNQYSEEAQQMIEGYQQLINEDTKWEEPTKEELAKFTMPQQIDYWMYHLRDHDYGQWSDPGQCDVFFNGGLQDEEKPNPAEELAKLGMAVVPTLIEHMEDIRPTRCKGHWRRFSPEYHTILRYGDCCQQIFERVTREQIYQRKTTTSYPTYDGSAADCKAKAQNWWDAYQKEVPVGRIKPQRRQTGVKYHVLAVDKIDSGQKHSAYEIANLGSKSLGQDPDYGTMKFSLLKRQYSISGLISLVAIVCIVLAAVRYVTSCRETAFINAMRKAGWQIQTIHENRSFFSTLRGKRCRFVTQVTVSNWNAGHRPENHIVEIEGTKALEALKQCSQITKLDLGGTDITEDSLLEMQSIMHVNSVNLSGTPSMTRRVIAKLANSKELQGIRLLNSRLTDDDLLPLAMTNSLNSLVVEGDLSGNFLSRFVNGNVLLACVISNDFDPSELRPLKHSKVKYLYVSCKPSCINIDDISDSIVHIKVFWDPPLDEADNAWIRAVQDRYHVGVVQVHQLHELNEYIGRF